MASSVAILSVGQNGRITIPAEFRKEHSLVHGGKVAAFQLGRTLVIAPHERTVESVLARFQKAAEAAGVTPTEVSLQALQERAAIVEQRYGVGSDSISVTARRRAKRSGSPSSRRK